MEIGPLKSSRPTQPEARANRKNSDPKQKPAHGDRVEISENARQKLAELADRALKGPEDGTTQSQKTGNDSKDGVSEIQKTESQDTARLAEIRRRIESGYYSRSDVKDRIADTMSDEFLD